MKRIISLLAVMAIMVAMVAASAAPAFAAPNLDPGPRDDTAPNCTFGNETASFGKGGLHRDQQATDSLDKNYSGIPDKKNGATCAFGTP
jgi:hypothetical protein